MKLFSRIAASTIVLLAFQSCLKQADEPEIIIDPYVYGHSFTWREDSIKTGNGSWTKIENGNTFIWLGNDEKISLMLQRDGGFATYKKTANLRADFSYVIANDSVFSFKLTSDSIYFQGVNKENRRDLNGYLSTQDVPQMTLYNTGVSPAVSIKYKLEN